MRRFVFKLVCGWVFFGVVVMRTSADEIRATPEFRFSEPMAEAAAWAKKEGWNLGAWQWAEGRAGRGEPELGDEVVVLAELTKKTKRQQWLIRLRVAELNEKEREKAAKIPRASIYVITGRQHEFEPHVCVIASEVAGPFVVGKKYERMVVKQGRALVGRQILAHGFYELGPWFTRLHDIKTRATPEQRAVFEKGWFRWQKPHDAPVLDVGRSLVMTYGVTERDELNYAMHWVGLMNYLGILIETPAMDDVLFEASTFSVAEILWNLALRRKLAPRFQGQEGAVLDGGKWGLGAGSEVRTLPHTAQIFGKPAMRFQIAVVEPKPPLATTAGVIGFAAMRPDRDDVHVMLRVLSGRAAGPGQQADGQRPVEPAVPDGASKPDERKLPTSAQRENNP